MIFEHHGDGLGRLEEGFTFATAIAFLGEGAVELIGAAEVIHHQPARPPGLSRETRLTRLTRDGHSPRLVLAPCLSALQGSPLPLEAETLLFGHAPAEVADTDPSHGENLEDRSSHKAATNARTLTSSVCRPEPAGWLP